MRLRWEGAGAEERGVDAKTGRSVVRIDSRYYRPTEVDILQGDASKARGELGWEPKVRFRELIRIMIDAELLDK
jgi:GDPmannose 4,6-dehydratase